MSYRTIDGELLTEEMIEEIAEKAERGELPGRPGRVIMGRPRISDEQLRLVGVKVPISQVITFDRRAAEHGQTRSQRLRELIEKDIQEG